MVGFWVHSEGKAKIICLQVSHGKGLGVGQE